MRIIQFKTDAGERAIGVTQENGKDVRQLSGVERLYDLALEAANCGRSLADLVASRLSQHHVDLASLLANRQVLSPIDHPDSSHCYVTGTGLTHLGSASARDAMHKTDSQNEPAGITDSSRMFQMGLRGGKPSPGKVGVQPEWFYKGNGDCIVKPEFPFYCPRFGLDVGEEPELVGLYINADDGTPCRIGFALGNELSDHVTEQQNYLYLAHSKLRPCSFGPELILGELPGDIRGTSRIVRDGEALWEAKFLTGEANMSHTIANLEHHHFKYTAFRKPGDLHCHFLGTATMSFSAGVRASPGDVFEISSPAFGAPLRNSIEQAPINTVKVRAM